MTSKRDYVGALQAKLDEWNAQIDELEARARRREARDEVKDRIEALKRDRDEAAAKLAHLRDAGEGAWDSLREGADQVWTKLKNTLTETKRAFEEGLRGEGGGEQG